MWIHTNCIWCSIYHYVYVHSVMCWYQMRMLICVNAHAREFTYTCTYFSTQLALVISMGLHMYVCECVYVHLHWAVSATGGFQIGFLLLGGGFMLTLGLLIRCSLADSHAWQTASSTAEKERRKERTDGKDVQRERVRGRQRGERWRKSREGQWKARKGQRLSEKERKKSLLQLV